MVTPLDQVFPALSRSEYRITSPVDKTYNCIAHAAGDTSKWWWPVSIDIKDAFWPQGVERTETLLAFRALFESLGYGTCDEDGFEIGFEKIAIFSAGETPTHAAHSKTMIAGPASSANA